MIKELWNKCCRRSYNAFLNVLCVCMFSVRWDMLVDSPPIIQTEVRGGESACWRWPHTGQHVLREISGEPVQPWRTCSLTLTPSHETSIFVLITEEMFGDATALFSLSIYLLALDLRREACATAWALMHPSSRPSGASPPSTLEGVLLKAGCCRQWYRCSRCFQTESKSRGNVGKQTGLLYLYFWKGNPPHSFSRALRLCVTVPGYLKGGDTFRLHHSHSDACLTLPSAEQGEEPQKWAEYSSVRSLLKGPLVTLWCVFRLLRYESGSVSSHARSLWRLEMLQVV